jgi:hypothetical protein
MEQAPIIVFSATVRSKAAPDAVYRVVADVATHLDWAGERARDKRFRLLTLDAAGGPASVGTTFASTGANSKNGGMTFHDRSTVTDATPPRAFAFETESRLERRHRPTWHGRFAHRYTITSDGSGARVDYTCAVYPGNYRPYWLHPLCRPATRRMVQRAMRRNMENLARLAEAAAVPR